MIILFLSTEERKRESKTVYKSLAPPHACPIGLLTPLSWSAPCSTVCSATPYVKRREAFPTGLQRREHGWRSVRVSGSRKRCGPGGWGRVFVRPRAGTGQFSRTKLIVQYTLMLRFRHRLPRAYHCLFRCHHRVTQRDTKVSLEILEVIVIVTTAVVPTATQY